MYNRESILKTLNEANYYIDKHSLDLFLHDWHIESIYEDETGLEFYDDLSLDRIKRGISLKAQGYEDAQIIAKLNRLEAVVERNEDEQIKPIMVKDYITPVEETKNEGTNETTIVPEKHFTLDVTSQTLQMLAEAVAKKISDDITNSDLATKLIEAGGYKKDNEILAKQVEDLLAHNKELSDRIELLENSSKKSIFKRIWGR